MPQLYGLAYSARSLDYLKLLSKKLRRQITEKVSTLAGNPHPGNAKLIQSTKNDLNRVFRIRSGDYRILYIVRDVDIVILDINHRKDAYR